MPGVALASVCSFSGQGGEMDEAMRKLYLQVHPEPGLGPLLVCGVHTLLQSLLSGVTP